MPPFVTRRRVEFCETDTAGIAHFSVFFLYMEQAEHALLRDLGLSVLWHDEQGAISWPRVNAQCEYRGSAKFEDVLEIAVQVDKLGSRSVTYGFEFTEGGRAIATGTMTSVCCRIEHGAAPQSISIPDWMADKLRPFLRSG